ncbi:hypothetical protein [Oleiharenicola lentus]|uniref:hypothetical protein n=1 Tax=Oleiharenicola lentus TaxID=2508720 RepID=UPI003F6684BB
MGKTTTYSRPSIEKQLLAVRTIEGLANYREALQEMFADKRMDPEPKTVRKWNEALWAKVFELLLAARSASEATYIFNVQMRWEKSPVLEAAVDQHLAAVVERMPDDVERAAHNGVVIEGISTPAQIAIAEAVRAKRNGFEGVKIHVNAEAAA